MSFRIDFEGGNGWCNGPQIIDRTFPGILSGKLSNLEWNAFCKQIDKAFEPTCAIMKYSRCILAGFVVFGMMLIVLFPLIVVEYLSISGPVYGICFMIILGMLLAERMRIEREVVSILMAESNKRAEVSFHLRKEYISTGSRKNGTTMVQQYIECSVSTGTGGDASMLEQGLVPTATAVVASEVVAPPTTSIFSNLAGSSAGAGSGPSTAQRLQDLEGIKALMCEEEYNGKKKDILDSI